DIREDYCKQALSQHDCDPNPIKQFEKWLNEAITAKVNEPTGVNVATVNEDGRPTSRMVLLKEVNEQGFVFFTNYHSRKGRAIEHNPFVALTFFWPELERSVRIEGKAEKISPEQSDEYFATRPYTSRIGAWASEQSAVVIPDRIEFWQGRPSRLHDRICYLYNDGKWERERLSP
ncbi:MAG: pyridoxal 5'-phosphate synthase, partial [Haemophilus parainfluenzae]|nr:pyridoxal 5'-phosphate synthase [Haemophilus parainfluenzae]